MMRMSNTAVQVLGALENSNEKTEHSFRIKHLLYHAIQEVISCTMIHPGNHHLSQDATMMLTGWKVTPLKSC